MNKNILKSVFLQMFNAGIFNWVIQTLKKQNIFFKNNVNILIIMCNLHQN
jgi:hypothetical protein